VTTSHTFAQVGAYSVNVTATDSDGTVVKMMMTVQVVPVDTAGPTATAGPLPMLSAAGDGTYTFTVTYSDAGGVLRASLGGDEITVVGPGGFQQLAQLVSVSSDVNQPSLTATYRVTVAGGAWTLANNGTYTVSLNAGSAADAAGNLVIGGTLGTFAVSVPGPDYAGNDRFHARNIQAFNPGRTAVYRDYVSAVTDIQDYYRFKINITSVMTIKVYELTSDASLQIRALDHKLIKSSTRAGTRYELISIALPPGSYYARVIGVTDMQTPFAIRFAVTAMPTTTTAAGASPPPTTSQPLSLTSVLNGAFADGATIGSDDIMGPFQSTKVDAASALVSAM
jgi:hypothetical protein